jgi:hypothetical protein
VITGNCYSCGEGPQDLPGDEICENCKAEDRLNDPFAYDDEEDDEQP